MENEVFAVQIDNAAHAETGEPGGAWLSLPATKEELTAALRDAGVTGAQNFTIRGFDYPEGKRLALSYDMVLQADINELNFLAARIAKVPEVELPKISAAAQGKQGLETIRDFIDLTYNMDYFVLVPDVKGDRALGDYYLNRSGMVNMPEEWKAGIDVTAFGKHIRQTEQGVFTQDGYLVKSGDEWERHYAEREIPEEYRIMEQEKQKAVSKEKPAQRESTVAKKSASAKETVTQKSAKKADVKEAQTQDKTPKDEPATAEVIPITLTSEKPADRMKEITDKLEAGVQALFDSEKYRQYLSVMSKFHHYSFRNTILIAMQKPDASLVAGFTAWQKNFERTVSKGQKGIKILAPAPFKTMALRTKIDPATRQPVTDKYGQPVKEQVEVTVPAFKITTVFDVSQTEGKELPTLGVEQLTGQVERFKDFFAALKKTSPAPIRFEKIEGGAHGFYSLEDKRIVLDKGMSELQTLKTAIHEISHAKLHDYDLKAAKGKPEQYPDKYTREVEAESVAYAVCQHYGIDTSDYSFGYIAGWSKGKEMTELKGSLEKIRQTAAQIIDGIDAHFAELDQKQEASKEKQAVQGAPTVSEIEAKAKAGEQVSVTELAKAIKREQGQGKTAARQTGTPAQGKTLQRTDAKNAPPKPSIRAQLAKPKTTEQAPKKPARVKTKGLEV